VFFALLLLLDKNLNFNGSIMKFITKIGVACTTVAIMASTSSYAGTVVTTGTLLDTYIGASANNTSTTDATPNSNYDILGMKVSRDISAKLLTVEVNSNFIGYNSSFQLGDLFLMDEANYTAAASCKNNTAFGCSENSYTSGTNKWEYAFDLGLDLDSTSTNNSTSNYINQTGQLIDIESGGSVTDPGSAYHQSVNTSSQLKGGGGSRYWQVVDIITPNGSTSNPATPSSAVGAGGNWSTDIGLQTLTMSFDITGTSLLTVDQIALRWAMSCANDIIEVVADLRTSSGGGGGSTPVPEPSTFMLMLLAGFGLFASKQKKAIKFKA